MRRLVPLLIVGLVVICGLVVAEPAEVVSTKLPQPSGMYGVGRIAYDWIDHSRKESLAKTTGAHRELMVYVWYPTNKKNSNPHHSPYLPGADLVAKSKDGESMRNFWGKSWEVVSSDKIRSETLDEPPVASGKERFPLITFSPGLDTPVTAYTTIIQELVSQGYVVASIEPTYEAPAVVFPDGLLVPFLPEAAGRNLPSPPGETREQFIKRMHKFDEPHLNRWAADIRFTIDKLSSLDSGDLSVAPFAGRLDLRNIAAWGHSFGGRAAARACQLDRRIKACLNADGLGPDGPIFEYEGAALPSQPFMWMEVYHEPPTDIQLARFGMTQKDWEKNHNVQLMTNERELRACQGGSYHVVVNTAGIGHLSFTDMQFITASTEQQREQASAALDVLAKYTAAFFDKELKRRNDTVLDGNNARTAGVTVKRYNKAK